MKREVLKKSLSLVLALVFLISFSSSAFASSVKVNDVPNDTYVYWKGSLIAVGAKTVYNYAYSLDSKKIGFDFSTLTDVAVDDEGDLYILDGEGGNVFVLDNSYKFLYSFSSQTVGDTVYDFSQAQGIEYRDGEIYICDSNNARVLVVDKKGTFIKEIGLPESDLIPDDFNYKPIKVAVDSKGYIYILSEGSYYGALLYSPEYEFLGFYGSNTVETGLLTAITTVWEKLTVTNQKRANSERKLPFQFTDLFVDKKDFIYTATGRTKNTDIEKGQIRRLNPGGNNVLTNSQETIFSDRRKSMVRFRVGNTWTIDANICYVVADDNGFMYCVDRESNKIFVFDGNCDFVTVMGGGNGDVSQKYCFGKISGIALNDEDLVVLDENKKNITILKLTDYGRDFLTAQAMVLNGDYSESREYFERVLAQDKNNQLAYIGLAKAYLADKNYKKAMQYAKYGQDTETYDQAHTYLRNEFLSKYFNVIAVVVLAVGVLLSVAIVYKRKKNIILIKSPYVKTALRVWTSPVDSFNLIKQKNMGSVTLATVFMFLLYISTFAKEELSGYQFIGAKADTYNSLLSLFKTVVAVLLFSVSNWAVAALMQGRGTLKEIYIGTCYSLLPLITGNFIYALLSNFVSLSEGAFLDIMMTGLTIYTVMLFVFALMAIHDISFGRFLGITLLSLFGILVVVFVGVIVFMLAQQLYMFIMTIVNEMIYR